MAVCWEKHTVDKMVIKKGFDRAAKLVAQMECLSAELLALAIEQI